MAGLPQLFLFLFSTAAKEETSTETSYVTKSEFKGFRNDINSKLDELKKLLKSKLTYLQYSENL